MLCGTALVMSALAWATCHHRNAGAVSRNDDSRTGVTTRTPPSASPTCADGLQFLTRESAHEKAHHHTAIYARSLHTATSALNFSA